jgi:hypothetical protein
MTFFLFVKQNVELALGLKELELEGSGIILKVIFEASFPEAHLQKKNLSTSMS